MSQYTSIADDGLEELTVQAKRTSYAWVGYVLVAVGLLYLARRAKVL